MQVAEVAGLLTLLCENGAEKGYEAHFAPTVGGKDGLDCRYGAKSDVGEAFGEEDGFTEGGCWEGVLAGSNRGLTDASEDGVRADGVDFFLLES